MKEYDVIVAGAGIAGSLAAATAAKNGAKTLLIDRNSENEPGKKTNWGWVCGDAVAKSHIDYIEKKLSTKFPASVLEHKVDGVYAISPDLQKKFLFEGEGYSINRPAFARFLRDLALKNGSEYLSGHGIDGPIIEGQKVNGVYGRTDKKEDFRIQGKLVIDALGISSMIRRKLPQNEYVEREISLDDVESTGRYIADFEQADENEIYYDPRNALIHLNQELAPGGYGWVFPRAGKRINIGLGIEHKSLNIRNEKLGKKDSLQSLIDKYVSWNPTIKKISIYNDANNGKGYWSVPVRRQLDSLVYTNYLGAGDSMAMPNPISAGGIGPAMVSGYLAGETAAEAINAKDTSINYLWRYNLKYNKDYGSKTAGLEVFRTYLQSLNNKLINYGMNNFLTEKEAEQISYGIVPELTIASTFKKVLSGVSNINAFSNLIYVVRKMKMFNELYGKYPKNVDGFPAWKAAVEKEMKEVKTRFKPNPV
jgi:geranylgeranyl reductase family protein